MVKPRKISDFKPTFKSEPAPVIASAIDDAVKPLGIKKQHNVPLSPNSIYEALIESGWEPKA